MAQTFLIGLSAGAIAALLFSALASGLFFSIGFFYLAPLPIMLAGLVANHLAGLVAALVAGLALGAMFSGWFFLAFSIGVGLPAYILSYLAMLGRPAANGGGEHMEWYPPGRLVLAGALLASAATAATIPAFGTDIDSYREALRASFERMLRAYSATPEGQPTTLPGGGDASVWLEALPIVMPPAAAVLSMLTGLGNLWLAGRMALVTGRLRRPWPDLGAITFPNSAPILLAGAIGVSFLPGLIGVVATILSATLLAAYAVLGFSVIHGASRAFPSRTIILFAVWLAVFILGWPILLVAMLGLADTLLDLRARAAGGGGGGPPDNHPRNPNE